MRKQNVFETLQGKKQQLLLATQVRPVMAGSASLITAGWLCRAIQVHVFVHLQVCKMILKIDDGELRLLAAILMTSIGNIVAVLLMTAT